MDQFINLLLKTLDQIQIKWFTAGQDYNTIKETKKYITDNFQNTSKPTNFKLKFLLEFLREKNIQDQSIIVSDNNNSEDINWMSMFIKSEYPGILLTHYHKKDYFILMHNTRTPVSVIFYLTSDKKIIGLAASNILANKQVFILNNKAYSHIELYFKFI